MGAKIALKYILDNGIYLYTESNKLKYKAKPGALTEEIIEIIKQYKTEFLEILYNNSDAQETVVKKLSLPKAPLSFAQERLWMIDKMQGGSPDYNISLALKVKGKFSFSTAELAISKIIKQYEILRTVYALEDETPVQVVKQQFEFHINQFDSVDCATDKLNVSQFVQKARDRKFDLKNDLMIRVDCIDLTEDEVILVFCVHHIACDAWSLDILTKDFIQNYAAINDGRKVEVDETLLQYSDYAMYQRKWFNSEHAESQLGYWRNRLADAPHSHSIPLDYPRNKQKIKSAGMTNKRLKPELLEALKVKASGKGMTLFMYLLAMVCLVLSRHSNCNDIVVGTTVANRRQKELEPLIGFFINTVALRVNTDFAELSSYLEHVRKISIDAQKNQDIPFEQIIQQLEIAESVAQNPFSQIAFTVENERADTESIAGLEFEPLINELPLAKTDLRISCHESIDGLDIKLKYNKNIFKETRIQRIADYLEQVLDKSVFGSTNNLDNILELPGSDYFVLTQSLNNTFIDYRDREPIHERIAKVAEHNSGHVAAVCGEKSITYGDLERLSTNLSLYLHCEKNISAKDRVAILLPTGIEYLLAILAVLKCGCSYIPLLINQGRSRFDRIIDDSKPALLISSNKLSAIHLHSSVPSITMDSVLDQQSWLQTYTCDASIPKVSLDDSSYVIYTSGSTGQPKGVEISHLGLLDYCQYALDHYYQGLSGSIVVTLPAFDITVPSLFLPLLSGGTVNMPEEESNLEKIKTMLIAAKGSRLLLRMTPMHVEGLMGMLHGTLVEDNHTFVIGGDEFTPTLTARMYRSFPNCRIFNHYGPSETVVGATIYELTNDTAAFLTKIPIGRPMTNTAVYVLDRKNRLLPKGAPGELYIGGSGVAKGYLNRPDLNDSVFCKNPFLKSYAPKLYATGDYVRWNEEDQLEFIGRIDNQVKIRGHRIELNEISETIKSFQGVKHAAVIIDDHHEKRIVAYVVTNEFVSDSDNGCITAIRSYLKEHLPDYMVPSAIIKIDSIPLNANGKLDKKLLPQPFSNHMQAPLATQKMSALEKYIADIWRQVLGLEKVNIDDNFFDIGGHSLSAIKVINKIQENIEEIVHLAVLFENPVLSELVVYLENRYRKAWLKLGLIQPGDVEYTGSSGSYFEVDSNVLDEFRQLVTAKPKIDKKYTSKNSKAVFILCPPRSGSTLLRVMLAGHPELFAPPELELIQFNSLEKRIEAFRGALKFRLEGNVRALMEVKGISKEDAECLMGEFEEKEMSVKDYYALLQQWISPLLLVDKTPFYSFHANILEHIEKCFENAHYIHLVRHPMATINSFIEAQMDQILHFKENSYKINELAELVWTNSQDNIIKFLKKIPKDRCHRVSFEKLVSMPQVEGRKICEFLNINYVSSAFEPYANLNDRMTDGIHADSRMIGDVKFHGHGRINPHAAKAWTLKSESRNLSQYTWNTASILGYEKDVEPSRFEAVPIIRQKNRERFPLSFSQQRLWVIDQIAKGKTHYNNTIALNVEGNFNVDVAELALGRIIQRHEILRTVYVTEGNSPCQKVMRDYNFAICRFNLEAVDDQKKQEKVAEIIRQEESACFDLASDLMVRVKFIKTHFESGILLFTIHHIASDGWSMGILVKEFIEQYKAAIDNKHNPLSELNIQYGDFSEWQRSKLQEKRLNSQLSYWIEAIDGAPPAHSIPLDFPRPEVKRSEGKWLHCRLTEHLTERLKSLARAHDVTLFMLLHSVLSIVIAKHSYSDDIIIGTPVANRRHKELEPLIGFFINTLILRTKVTETYFADYLQHVREVDVRAQNNQDLPFDVLVEKLRVPRDISISPVFQIIFNLGNHDSEELKLPGIKFSEYGIDRNRIRFDLHLVASEIDGRLDLNWGYDTSIFAKETIESINLSFNRLLEQIINQPQVKISELEFVSVDEKLKLIDGIQGSQRDIARLPFLHQRFESTVSEKGNAVAVFEGAKSYSFDYLNRETNRIANFLVDKVKKSPFVALLLDRSVESIVSIFATLKAGLAYIPIDIHQPKARIEEIIQDANVGYVLTKSQFSHLIVQTNVKYCCLDESSTIDALSSYNEDRVINRRPIDSSTPAYVIFTSGSTGKPKGVACSHNNLRYFSSGFEHQLGVLGADVNKPWLWNASYAFDVSLKGLVLLSLGTCLVIPSEEEVRTPYALVDLIEYHNISVFNTQPVFMAYMLKALRNRDIAVNLIVSGDCVSGALRNKIHEYCTKYGVRAINAYGPTETSVNASFAVITEAKANSIGQPMENAEIYILDENKKLVASGAAGQLYIGGQGLALGYLNAHTLTEKKFISNPYKIGERIFATGDLVRYLPNNEIEFLGRCDDQVKIRGYRIELGDVQSAFDKVSVVKQAYVTTTPGIDGETTLIAYVVVNDATDSDTLMAAIGDYLPEYMRPSRVIILDDLPLTKSGKIDTFKLPRQTARLEKSEPSANKDVRERLRDIWQELLTVDHAGDEDDFFKLGGHSLLGILLFFEIEKNFGVVMDAKDLYSHLTLSDQVRLVQEKIKRKELDSNLESSTEIGKDKKKYENIPLSFSQQRLWFIDRLQGGSSEYNMPMAFHITGNFNVDCAEQAIRAIIDRHEILRTTYSEQNGIAVQEVHTDKVFNIYRENLQHLSDEAQKYRIRELIEEDAQRPFDLTSDLMLRASYIESSAKNAGMSGIFIINMHHIASDAPSITIFLNEFVSLYVSILDQSQAVLPKLEAQYRDYALWQRQRLDDGRLSGTIGYWCRQLADIPILHSVSLDYSRPEYKQYHGEQISTLVDKSVNNRLRELARGRGLSQFMLLHAALALVFGRHSNNHDIIIGTPVTNRVREELTPLIGFFLNLLVLRVNTRYTSFQEYLDHVKQVHVEAQEHQDLPFEYLVEQLNVPRSTSHAPVFQILFTFNSEQRQNIEIPQVKVESAIDTKRFVAKYDLTIGARETEEGLHISWVYDRCLFSHSHVEQIAQHFVNMLDSIAHFCDSHVSALNMIGSGEYRQILGALKGNDIEYSGDTVLSLFEYQAKHIPDEIAVVCQEDSLTYKELNAASNQLAHYLISQSVSQRTPVGICIERNANMLISMLAVLKSGAVYVPMDPELPSLRLLHMIEDSGTGCIIADDKVLSALNLPLDTKTIVLDNEKTRKALFAQPEDAPIAGVEQANERLAYIIYTSGSTGRPKGVMVDHRALINLVVGMKEKMGNVLDAKNGLLSITTFSFDIAALEIFGPICYGGTVFIATRSEVVEPLQLMRLIEHPAIKVMQGTPSTWQMLIDAGWQGKHDLVALCGGEALELSVAEKLLPRCKTLLNCYGPTEATIWSMVTAVTRRDIQQGQIRLNGPLANYQHLVIDHDHNLCPYGAVGELCIAGIGLASGYHNNPALTRERFVTLDLGDDLVKRFYKTGDLARLLPDNRLEFMGRSDNQVKVRGYRIELGEIEYQLCQCEGLSSSLVVAQDNSTGEPQLVAYVISSNAYPDLTEKLKVRLRKTLPAYMIPSVFVQLDQWPLTYNGKIDRKRLPRGDLFQQAHIPPETPVQRELVNIWSELLSLDSDDLSIDADIFALGGHSLLIVQLVAEVRKRFKVELEMRDLFKYVTVREQAKIVQELTESIHQVNKDYSKALAYGGECIIRLNHCQSGINLFCLPPGAGSAMVYFDLSSGLRDTACCYGLQPPQIYLNREFSNLETMVNFYLDLIKLVQPMGPYYLLGYSQGAGFAYELACQMTSRGEQIAFLGLVDEPPFETKKRVGIQPWYRPIKTAFENYVNTGFSIDWESLDKADVEQGLDLIEEELAYQKIRIPGVTKNLLRPYLRYFLSKRGLIDRHEHTASNLNLTVFRTLQALDSDFVVKLSDSLDWDKHSRGNIDVQLVDGNHHTIMSEPKVSQLVEYIKSKLQRH